MIDKQIEQERYNCRIKKVDFEKTIELRKQYPNASVYLFVTTQTALNVGQADRNGDTKRFVAVPVTFSQSDVDKAIQKHLGSASLDSLFEKNEVVSKSQVKRLVAQGVIPETVLEVPGDYTKQPWAESVAAWRKESADRTLAVKASEVKKEVIRCKVEPVEIEAGTLLRTIHDLAGLLMLYEYDKPHLLPTLGSRKPREEWPNGGKSKGYDVVEVFNTTQPVAGYGELIPLRITVYSRDGKLCKPPQTEQECVGLAYETVDTLVNPTTGKLKPHLMLT